MEPGVGGRWLFPFPEMGEVPGVKCWVQTQDCDSRGPKGSCTLAWGWVEGGLGTAERPCHPVQLPNSRVKLGSCPEGSLPSDEHAGSIPKITPRDGTQPQGFTEPQKSTRCPKITSPCPREPTSSPPGGSPPFFAHNSSGSRMDNHYRAWSSHPDPLLCKGLPGGFPPLPAPRDTHQSILPDSGGHRSLS